VHEFDVSFRLKSRPDVSYSFDEPLELEYGKIRLETKNGAICGRMTISLEKDDYDLVEREALKELEKLASILTLLFGTGLLIEDMRMEHKPLIEYQGNVIKVTLFEAITVKVNVAFKEELKFFKEELSKIKAELEGLKEKINEWERKGKGVLKAIKWWRKGYLEEDGVDKFLDYFISFEMLASTKGYKKKYSNWAKMFSKDYSITYELNGKRTISWIRNAIMHEPGPEKDEAEKLANQYADRFGKELLKAIKKIIIEEEPS